MRKALLRALQRIAASRSRPARYGGKPPAPVDPDLRPPPSDADRLARLLEQEQAARRAAGVPVGARERPVPRAEPDGMGGARMETAPDPTMEPVMLGRGGPSSPGAPPPGNAPRGAPRSDFVRRAMLREVNRSGRDAKIAAVRAGQGRPAPRPAPRRRPRSKLELLTGSRGLTPGEAVAMGTMGGAIPAVGIGTLAATAWDPLIGPQTRWAANEEARMRALWEESGFRAEDARDVNGVRIAGSGRRPTRRELEELRRYLAMKEAQGAYEPTDYREDSFGRDTGY